MEQGKYSISRAGCVLGLRLCFTLFIQQVGPGLIWTVQLLFVVHTAHMEMLKCFGTNEDDAIK